MLWQQFLEQRSNVVGNKMQREVQTIVTDASRDPRSHTPHSHIFPSQVQKIVMDFLKENKDGGKVSAVNRDRGACALPHRTLTPLTPSALPCIYLHRW